jgi:hypothetical protein
VHVRLLALRIYPLLHDMHLFASAEMHWAQLETVQLLFEVVQMLLDNVAPS